MKFLFAFVLLVLVSCQKDCEKDGTATVTIQNDTELVAYIYEQIGNDYPLTIEPGDSFSYEMELVNYEGFEIGQTSISFKFEGDDRYRSTAFKVFQCQNSIVQITK